jgi:hypothetical protein
MRSSFKAAISDSEIHKYSYIYHLAICKGKVKVVPVPEHHAMKAYWGNGSIAPRIL